MATEHAGQIDLATDGQDVAETDIVVAEHGHGRSNRRQRGQQALVDHVAGMQDEVGTVEQPVGRFGKPPAATRP